MFVLWYNLHLILFSLIFEVNYFMQIFVLIATLKVGCSKSFEMVLYNVYIDWAMLSGKMNIFIFFKPFYIFEKK